MINGNENRGNTDAPRVAGCQLLALDDALLEPAVNGGGGKPKLLGCPLYGQKFALRLHSRPLIAGYFPVLAQARNAAGGEAVAIKGA